MTGSEGGSLSPFCTHITALAAGEAKSTAGGGAGPAEVTGHHPHREMGAKRWIWWGGRGLVPSEPFVLFQEKEKLREGRF